MYELGNYHLVHGRLRVPHAGRFAWAGLVATTGSVGQFAFFLDGGSDRVLRGV
jgi:hypothetical protein